MAGHANHNANAAAWAAMRAEQAAAMEQRRAERATEKAARREANRAAWWGRMGREVPGAYEYAEAVAPEELRGAILGAKEEARDLLDSNGSGWVSVLVGVGECVDDVDAENAEQVITFEA